MGGLSNHYFYYLCDLFIYVFIVYLYFLCFLLWKLTFIFSDEEQNSGNQASL